MSALAQVTSRATARMTDALRSDVVSGSLLIGAALVAVVWANSPLAPAYEALRTFTMGPASLRLDLPVRSWAADGLLAVFFFVVGNELKQEVVHGELRDPRRAALPIVGALGGVLVPAAVFAVLNARGSGASAGWGIPMATDIAFAVAVLAVVGRHLPAPLRTFLVHASGVHATIAGVAMGLLMRTTTRDREQTSPSQRVENVLRPVSAGLALPVFALMSAGVQLVGAGGVWSSTITWGILGGLIGGKIIGILGSSWLTARFTGAHLNPLLGWGDIAGIAVLGGIGFTVSLLIAELSYPAPAQLTYAKAAILLASAVSSLLAAAILGTRNRHHRAVTYAGDVATASRPPDG